jgi:hypothetical protein
VKDVHVMQYCGKKNTQQENSVDFLALQRIDFSAFSNKTLIGRNHIRF